MSNRSSINLVLTSVSFLALVFLSIAFIKPWGKFPLNDDWVYTKNVLNSLREGHLSIKYSQHAWALPQVFLGKWIIQNTKEVFLSLRWIGIVSGVLSALLMGFASRLVLGGSETFLIFLSCVTTYFYLPFLQPSLSFMSDMPAFLFWFLSILVTAYYLEKEKKTAWFVAFLIFLLAVSERQVAVLIPASIFPIKRISFKTKASLLFFFLPVALIQWWWNSVSQSPVPGLGLSPNLGLFVRLSRHFVYLGWIATPFLALPIATNKESKFNRTFKWGLVVFGAGFVGHLLTSYFKNQEMLAPMFGNVLSSQGILMNLISGSVETIFGNEFRYFLTGLGVFGAIRIIYGFSLLVQDKSLNSWILLTIYSSLAYLIFIGIRALQFDRYGIPLIPLVLICILKSTEVSKIPFWRKFFSLMLLAPYIFFSVTLTHDYFRWNEARWMAVNEAYERSVKPMDLDAGYEYYGWVDGTSSWPDQKNYNFVISLSELPNFRIIKKINYKMFWGEQSRWMYLLEKKTNP